MISKEIQNAFPALRKSEQKAAKYMMEHAEQMEKITLEELAKQAEVSQPTIMRLLKTVGYQSFKAAKVAFIEERLKTKGEEESYQILGMPIDKNDQIEEVPAKVIRNTIQLLEDSLQAISAKSLKKAVHAIQKARRVCIFSVEDSNTIAYDLLTKLKYLGIACEFNEDYYLQSITAGHMTDQDVAISISYTGTSRNTVDVLAQAKRAGAKTIAITNFLDTPLVENADIVILTSNKQFLYGSDIFSRTIHLAVVDMIYMGILVEDYEKYTVQIEESSKLISSRRCEKEE
ncbi:MAG: MurR/RpiR family transcriptional regulator [Lachnospiraceae bacterium]|nr:MurR/RpiR family transcriptional regulator [Lachnospiraceae bacterium]